MTNNKKILVVRKMSALEYYYNGNHQSSAIRESAENHNREVARIERILKQNNLDFNVVTRNQLSENLILNYDALISAGGDGTVIASAFYNLKTPQLNLKTDSKSIGALCQGDIKDAINNFLSGNYSIENWTRQDVYLDGKFVGRASNEVCIGEGLKFSKLAKYDLSFSDYEMGLRMKDRQSSSGLIVVTGTGSTGWPAAFKPFAKDSLYFEFTNLLLHSGDLDMGRTDKLIIGYRGHEGKFSIDTVEHDFPRDSELEIQVSKYPLQVIVPTK